MDPYDIYPDIPPLLALCPHLVRGQLDDGVVPGFSRPRLDAFLESLQSVRLTEHVVADQGAYAGFRFAGEFPVTLEVEEVLLVGKIDPDGVTRFKHPRHQEERVRVDDHEAGGS